MVKFYYVYHNSSSSSWYVIVACVSVSVLRFSRVLDPNWLRVTFSHDVSTWFGCCWIFLSQKCLLTQLINHLSSMRSLGVHMTAGCFINILRALQSNLTKICIAKNHIYGENFKLKLCTCAQSNAKLSREYFGDPRNISETAPSFLRKWSRY